MATTKEILEREHENRASIFLHREGAFWKAYQKSAFQVHRREPNFKVKIAFVKAVNAVLVSVGFPEGTVKRLFNPEEIEHINEKTMCIPCAEISEEEYTAWLSATKTENLSRSISVQRAAHTSSPAAAAAGKEVFLSDVSLPYSGRTTEEHVLQRLREFPMEASTPIDCMMFLASIRKELISDGHL